jgi:hypothetical protein
MTTRKLQDIYDEMRKCESVIEEANEAKRRKREITEKLKKLEIDLKKQNKIKWENRTFEEWFRNKEEDFWIYSSDTSTKYGIWKGLNSLSDEDLKHWEEFQHDYFYYGYPLYRDKNDPNFELSECDLHFESYGRLHRISADDF